MDDKDLCMMFGELKGVVKADNENFEKKLEELKKIIIEQNKMLTNHNEFIANFKTDLKWVKRIAGTVSALVSIIVTFAFKIFSILYGGKA